MTDILSSRPATSEAKEHFIMLVQSARIPHAPPSTPNHRVNLARARCRSGTDLVLSLAVSVVSA